MNDKLKALAQKWDGENGDYPESKRDCAAELRALAATLTPLGDKDREAVRVLAQAAEGLECVADAATGDIAAAMKLRVAEFNQARAHIATRLAERGGGDSAWLADQREQLERVLPPQERTTPPAAAVESEPGNCMCCGAPCTIGTQTVYPFPGKRGEPEEFETFTYSPPTPSAGVSEAMVEAARKAIWENRTGTYDRMARAALAAAEGVKNG